MDELKTQVADSFEKKDLDSAKELLIKMRYYKKCKKVLGGGSGTQKVSKNTAYLQHGFGKSSSLSRSGAANQIHGAKTRKCWHFSEVGCSRG